MKNTVGFIFPNKTELLKYQVKSVAKRLDITIASDDANFVAAVPVAKKLLNDNPQIIAFVARDNTASYIRNVVNVPVVSLTLPEIEYAKAIVQASKDDKSDIAFIQFKGGRLVDTDALSSVCGVKVVDFQIDYFIDNYDYARLVISHGIHRVLTTNAPIADACYHFGLKVINAAFTEKLIYDAFEKAVQYGTDKLFERKQQESMRNSLNYINDGVLTVDSNNEIIFCNKRLLSLTGAQETQVIGLPVDTVASRWDFLGNVIKTGDGIVNYCDRPYYISSVKDKPNSPNARTVFVTSIEENINLTSKMVRHLNERIYVANNSFDDIYTLNPRMKSVKNEARLYSKSAGNVLITGESGTGKDLFAQAIHNESMYKNAPFVAINCAALPENLLESELFGYEKGAFTGARKDGKTGLIEVANGGTLFLDEISTLTPSLQAKILRFIQEKKMIKVGGTQLIDINCRLICATNDNLEKAINEGRFRQDLYYRINVLPVHIPPLRERTDDIPYLAQLFIKRLLYKSGIEYIVPSQEDLRGLKLYDWPGNVRQLMAFVERLVILSDKKTIDNTLIDSLIAQMPAISGVQKESAEKNNRSIKEREYEIIRKTYEKNKGNLTKTREELGISRTTLWKKLKEMGIQNTDK